MLKQISYKWFAVFLLVPMFSFTAVCAAINVAFDPFGLYIRGDGLQPVLMGGRGLDRYQHSATVRNYAPESIVLGHSHAANFLPTDIEDKLGWSQVYSVTLDGGPLHEHSLVGRYALSNSVVKNVLWLVAPYNFLYEVDGFNPKMPFPEILYDDSRANDFNLAISLPFETLKFSGEKLQIQKSLYGEEGGDRHGYDFRDYSTSWFSKARKRFGDKKGVATKILRCRKDDCRAALLNLLEGSTSSVSTGEIADAKSRLPEVVSENWERNIRPLVSSNPSVNFELVIHPPFPYLLWLNVKKRSTEGYLRRLATIKYIVEQASTYENLTVYGFGLYSDASDLGKYKDATHYHIDVNRKMIDSIARKDGILTDSNIDAYLQQFDAAITSYSSGLFVDEIFPQAGDQVSKQRL
ncbi:hypothetical protein [Parahaliea aestuarii]|uniref:Uncharacterized protein n=1 Tax=Parahaliea aestuarii TaxID=1852021 RepID=A0A5C8ZNV8_9GAMM|nr:hypothetical protein [Parahaliea aestuarii]TXS89410.1 hypothetical protein FVW59_18005 [Parahaliea aestuarii]